MYKIISKGVIIDLVDSLKFYKFLPKSKHFVCTDSSTANCLEGSNYQIYILQGRNFPEGYDYPRVQYALATQADYDKFNKLTDKLDYKDKSMLELARSSKIRFLDKACSDKINQGIDVYLSDGYKYHFDLKLEDQLNLRRIEQQLNAGATQCIYHAKGSCSRIFSKEDMLEIIASLAKLENKSLNDVINVAKLKYEKRGGFEKKIFLIDVAEKSINPH